MSTDLEVNFEIAILSYYVCCRFLRLDLSTSSLKIRDSEMEDNPQYCCEETIRSGNSNVGNPLKSLESYFYEAYDGLMGKKRYRACETLGKVTLSFCLSCL